MVMIALLIVVIVAALGLVAAAMRTAGGSQADMRQRLSTATTGRPAANEPSLLSDTSRSPWARLVQAVERRGVSLTDSKAEGLAERLMLAGYDEPYAVRAFVLIKTGLIVGLPLLAYIVMALTMTPSAVKMYIIIAGAATVGMYVPNMIVSSKATERGKEILNGFPDALDLMLVCVDAGLGIDASLSRVGSEITQSHPLLAELLATASLELRAGRTRDVALRNLARRTGLPELVAFVTLLNQSAKLGSSVGQALKIYGAEMREGRRMRAEEKAARLPVLLSIPLVAFLLPTMVAVLLLPAAINVHANLSHASHGK